MGLRYRPGRAVLMPFKRTGVARGGFEGLAGLGVLPNNSRLRRLDAGKRPSIWSRDAFANFLDCRVVRRIPEGVDCVHGGEFEHDHRPGVMLAFEDVHLGPPCGQLAAKLCDEGTTASRYF